MLPAVITAPVSAPVSRTPRRFGRAAIAAVTALAIGLTAAAPAQALGRNERNFLKGVAAAMLVDRLLDEARRNQKPRYVQPQYVQPRPVYRQVYRPAPHHDRYQPPVRPSIWMTPAAQAFNSYNIYDRRRIQGGLAARGYYRGGIDGAFGPGTYSAIVAYANDRGRGRDLGSAAGVYGLFDGLVY
ncbi:peptidoglycan-binding protein [Gemmobacter lutimaris]|uniref:peptidoglycan-binding protein n=1 Tax=Gemmobacter lutimaris TaxID=2306023 RepID=UPI001F294CF1|nr:peptidoglycan-binding protein [Gemmobacter lutimaris]